MQAVGFSQMRPKCSEAAYANNVGGIVREMVSNREAEIDEPRVISEERF